MASECALAGTLAGESRTPGDAAGGLGGCAAVPAPSPSPPAGDAPRLGAGAEAAVTARPPDPCEKCDRSPDEARSHPAGPLGASPAPPPPFLFARVAAAAAAAPPAPAPVAGPADAAPADAPSPPPPPPPQQPPAAAPAGGRAARLLRWLRGLRAGADLSRVSLPIHTFLPASALSCWASFPLAPGRPPPAARLAAALLDPTSGAGAMLADAGDPVRRMLGALALLLDAADPPAAAAGAGGGGGHGDKGGGGGLRKPFNPVLGETERVRFSPPAAAALSAAAVAVAAAEQVSHHPPVSCFALWAETGAAAAEAPAVAPAAGGGLAAGAPPAPAPAPPARPFYSAASFACAARAAPRLEGFSIAARITGARTLTLYRPAAAAAGCGRGAPAEPDEAYAAGLPSLRFRLLPTPAAGLSGAWSVACAATGLRADVRHEPLPAAGRHAGRLSGAVVAAAAAGGGGGDTRLLYAIAGVAGGEVVATCARTGARTVLPCGGFGGAAAAAAAPLSAEPLPPGPGEAKPSAGVWDAACAALRAGRMGEAAAAKAAVEGAERAAARRGGGGGGGDGGCGNGDGALPPRAHTPLWFQPDGSGGWAPVR